MDPGVLYQKFVGETEARLREALQQAEAMAPVVFWIDEIEKAFASASSESADGGLSQRMFGTLLTVSRWEGMKPSPSGEAFRYTIVDGKLSNFCPYAF